MTTGLDASIAPALPLVMQRSGVLIWFLNALRSSQLYTDPLMKPSTELMPMQLLKHCGSTICSLSWTSLFVNMFKCHVILSPPHILLWIVFFMVTVSTSSSTTTLYRNGCLMMILLRMFLHSCSWQICLLNHRHNLIFVRKVQSVDSSAPTDWDSVIEDALIRGWKLSFRIVDPC